MNCQISYILHDDQVGKRFFAVKNFLGNTPYAIIETSTGEHGMSDKLAERLDIIHLMIKDVLDECRDELIDQPEVFMHLQMADKHLYNAVLSDQKNRVPVPEPTADDAVALSSRLHSLERFTLRSLAKNEGGMNKALLGNENERLLSWGLVESDVNLIRITEKGKQVNQLLNIKPAQRAELKLAR